MQDMFQVHLTSEVLSSYSRLAAKPSRLLSPRYAPDIVCQKKRKNARQKKLNLIYDTLGVGCLSSLELICAVRIDFAKVSSLCTSTHLDYTCVCAGLFGTYNEDPSI